MKTKVEKNENQRSKRMSTYLMWEDRLMDLLIFSDVIQLYIMTKKFKLSYA